MYSFRFLFYLFSIILLVTFYEASSDRLFLVVRFLSVVSIFCLYDSLVTNEFPHWGLINVF